MADIYLRNIRDWREATLMLSFEEKGYYDELLNLIYMFDDLLPDDDGLICRAMPINKRTHQRLQKRILKVGLLTIKDGFYHNKRASIEVSKINQISDKNRMKAESRWAKLLKNNESSNAGHMQRQMQGQMQRQCRIRIRKMKKKDLIKINKKV